MRCTQHWLIEGSKRKAVALLPDLFSTIILALNAGCLENGGGGPRKENDCPATLHSQLDCENVEIPMKMVQKKNECQMFLEFHFHDAQFTSLLGGDVHERKKKKERKNRS